MRTSTIAKTKGVYAVLADTADQIEIRHYEGSATVHILVNDEEADAVTNYRYGARNPTYRELNAMLKNWLKHNFLEGRREGEW